MARLMKNSGIQWIGDIPQNWKIIRLKNCISQRDSGAWGENIKNNENDIVCIRIADFDYSKMTIKNFVGYEFTKRNYKKDIINKLQLHLNDILIEKSGGGEKTPVGRTIIFNKNFPCLFSNFMDRLRVNKIIINPKFLQYMFVTFYTNGYVKNYIKQTTGIQNLDITSLLSNENVSIPPIDEQQRIVNYLDEKCSKIDETIEKEKAIIEKLKEYKQSLITETVTKGLNSNVPMKDSGIDWIGSIPQHWETIKIKHSCWLKGRIGWQGLTAKEYQDNGAYLITGTDFKNGSIDWNTCVHISEGRYQEAPEIHIQENDLLITKDGTIGKVAITKNTPQKVSLNSGVLLIRQLSNNKYIEKYLYYCLISNIFWAWFNSNKTGNSTILHLYQEKFKEYIYTLPPMEEQEEISKYLDEKCNAIDNAITQRETLIDKLTEYKKSLIYECVTGKKEV